MDKSFNFPIEELARRNPDFAKTWQTITQQTRQKLVYAQTHPQKQEIIQQSNQLIWQEILRTIKTK